VSRSDVGILLSRALAVYVFVVAMPMLATFFGFLGILASEWRFAGPEPFWNVAPWSVAAAGFALLWVAGYLWFRPEALAGPAQAPQAEPGLSPAAVAAVVGVVLIGFGVLLLVDGVAQFGNRAIVDPMLRRPADLAPARFFEPVVRILGGVALIMLGRSGGSLPNLRRVASWPRDDG
jgi:hypothetical protein